MENYDCPDEFGIYKNMVGMKFPRHMMSVNGGHYSTKDSCQVDKCLVEEIMFLWENGIHTMNCCCGHGKILGSICVRTNQDGEKMIKFGYQMFAGVDIDNCFIAKSKHINLITP